MNAFLFYVDDWLSSRHVEMMDAAEERGYLRLLLRSAKEEDCGIPDDDTQLAIMSMLGGQWRKPTADKSRRVGGKTSGQKLRECFEVRDGRMYNLRLLKEFDNQRRIREERRIAGSKGGRPRVNENQLVSNSLAIENQMGKQNESKEKQAQALSPALPNGKEPPISPAVAAEDRLRLMGWEGVSKTSEKVCDAIADLDLKDFPESRALTSPYMIICRLNWFNDFMAFYWRQDDKRKARVKYFEKVTSHELQETVEQAVIAQTVEMTKREKQHRKLAATWLHGECWMNQPSLLDGDVS